jgi:hypothetical protein
MAMGCHLFEIGVFRPETSRIDASMLLRVWSRDTLLHCAAWLRLENEKGRHIYIRPKGEHNLSLVDDLTAAAIAAMKYDGFNPALVVETSPSNFQAWLKHPEPLHKELSTATARVLAQKYGGDAGAADWRHFGRLSGFENRKRKYQDVTTGLYPVVRIIEAEGRVYPQSDQFLAMVRATLEERHRVSDRFRRVSFAPSIASHLKTIDNFRSDIRYAGDGNRIDLAYAVYALSHGSTQEEVAATIRTRDLSKKGAEHRQQDYVERTIRKAGARLQERNYVR